MKAVVWVQSIASGSRLGCKCPCHKWNTVIFGKSFLLIEKNHGSYLLLDLRKKVFFSSISLLPSKNRKLPAFPKNDSSEHFHFAIFLAVLDTS
jgi:hypothetical protein